jgi:molecular chaperone GrpE (heat shock protein)
MPNQLISRSAFRLALLVFLPTIAFPAAAAAQNSSGQQEPLGDAARRAREQKQKSQKTAKVITSDDLNAKSGSGGVQNATATPPPGTAAAGQDQPAAAGETARAASPEEQAQKNAELVDLKKQLTEIQKDFDLFQREFSLERQQFYQNPDPSTDKAGKAALDALEREVNEKQHSVESLKSRVAALEELLKSQGVYTPPAQPGSAQPPADANQPAPARP